jgi:uncharacterized protein
MIVLDVNLLLYAYDTASAEHKKARSCIEELFSGEETVGLPWQTVTAFIRIMTYPGLMGERFSLASALAIVDQWLDIPQVRLLVPGDDHWTLLKNMLVDGDARGKLTTDASLAALTIEHGGVLYSNDRDFARFPGLRWVNPLAAV